MQMGETRFMDEDTNMDDEKYHMDAIHQVARMLWSTWIMQLMIWMNLTTWMILHSCPWNSNHHPFGWISSTWLVTFVWSTYCISVIYAVTIFLVFHVMYVVNFIHVSKFHPFEYYYKPCCRFYFCDEDQWYDPISSMW